MSIKKCYDIHCHAFNLSHPSLLPFIERLNLNLFLSLNAIPGIGFIISRLFKSKITTIMNLLSVIENDMGDYFFLMENDLKPLLNNKNQIRIGSELYDRVVLTPLMMDFGQKEIDQYPGIHYSKLSSRTIVEQVIDLFNGIKKYKKESGYKLFEIYPFLGLNTQNYTMEKTKDRVSLPELLDRYFKRFSANSIKKRPARLYEKMGTFNGDVDSLKSYSYAGIKMYPPLGFDPWPPDGDKEGKKERKKVEYLYRFCADKQIPITTHCSDGGFIVSKRAGKYTSPERWQEVLKKYDTLRLNFAHFGNQDKLFSGNKWRKMVIDLVMTYPNVYADFSYCGVSHKFYRRLEKIVSQHPGVEKKILFGSDFMINLLGIDSYRGYFNNFKNAKVISSEQKNLFCSANPERFLFGI